MTIRLVGAGLPRTGTMSLSHALSRLLDAPCYHMTEVFAHPEHVPVWRQALAGRPPVWSDFLAGYAAGVDTPFSSCWRELAAAYPDAPVLLSHRGSAETWYASMERTVLARTREVWDGPEAAAALDDRVDEGTTDLFRAMFADVFTDPWDAAQVRAGYDRRLAEVRAEIDPDRLVEWQPGDGWEPLCRALDLPVPDEDFPRTNSTAEFVARTEEMRSQER